MAKLINPKDADLSFPSAKPYRTQDRKLSWLARLFPTPHFYRQFLWNVYRSSRIAKRGHYDGKQWSETSQRVVQSLESVGVRFEIDGVSNIQNLESPCVFVGNHMSMLETIVLPSIVQPIRDVTFVVKQSLLDYPFFRHIVRARNPIPVSRQNARDDFKVVMKEGVDYLRRGISVVVFPQTTRSESFDPAEFNSIGVKLAARAGVPIIPIALRSDAWGNGKRLKDFGPIDKTKTVHFDFGPAVKLQGRGEQQQQEIIEFIQDRLRTWGVQPSAV